MHVQEGRRAVDRLLDFTLIPGLNRKLVAGLPAGRMQLVVVRLVLERERPIQRFSDTFTVPEVATLQTSCGELLRARRTSPQQLTALNQTQAYLPPVGRGVGFKVLRVEKSPWSGSPHRLFPPRLCNRKA